jgi:sortase (surface protein transpeptidase)
LAAPTGLQVPAIGVNTTVVPLGQNADGTAQVPSGFNFTGWYDLGPKPGQVGPAVILGHVDSTSGPAVFYRLGSLLPGDAITVDDGSQAVSFVVSRVVTYAKDQFPTAEVFGPTPDAELRLITCGGPFDYSIGHYEDNIVVYAVATGSLSS